MSVHELCSEIAVACAAAEDALKEFLELPALDARLANCPAMHDLRSALVEIGARASVALAICEKEERDATRMGV